MASSRSRKRPPEAASFVGMTPRQEPAAHPVRHRLFLSQVRNRLVVGLQKQGYGPAQAKQMVSELTDEAILDAAVHDKIQLSAVTGGGFLDWIVSHAGQFAQLVQTLLTILQALQNAPAA